ELVTHDVGLAPFWRAGAFHAAHQPSHSMVAFSLHDKGPGPLTYLLDGAFARLARPLHGEFWLRIPGITVGIISILYLLRVGSRWTGGRYGGVVMAAFAAVFPAWVDWSTGARGYAWAIFLGLLQFDYLFPRRNRGLLTGSWLTFNLLAVLG